MNKKFIYGSTFFMLFIGATLGIMHVHASTPALAKFSTFYDWKKECDKLPRFNESVTNPFKTALSEKDLAHEIDLFFQTMKKQFEKIVWISGAKPAVASDTFQAYVEKLILPVKSIVAIHGDFHGDIRAINRFIDFCTEKGLCDEKNPFKIKADNFYIVFLGDYVDRGWYGAEVLYTILRLKNENPDRVFMARGNHEDMDLNAHYDFKNELLRKFSSSQLLKKTSSLYNTLPLALYLGSGKEHLNIIQCCHGGIEIGFNPQKLLEHPEQRVGDFFKVLMQKKESYGLISLGLSSFSTYFKDNKIVDSSNGFMWNDFIVNPNKTLSLSARDGYAGTLFEYGKKATKKLLQSWSGEKYTLRSIFRAHQHSDEDMCNRIFNSDKLGHLHDIGVAKLWIESDIHRVTPYLLDDISVVTFSVAPETEYGWPFHSFGLLFMNSNYKDWRLLVYRKDYQN